MIEFNGHAISEFSEDQLEVIRNGLQKGLDVSVYAKPEYNADHMKMLNHALNHNKNVYLDKFYQEPDSEQESYMKISELAYPEISTISTDKMELLYNFLRDNSISLRPYINFDISQMQAIGEGLYYYPDVDVSFYADLKYDAEQMRLIQKGVHLGLTPKESLSSYTQDQINVLRKGNDIGLSPEQSLKYDIWQISEIKDIAEYVIGHNDTKLNDFLEKIDPDDSISQIDKTGVSIAYGVNMNAFSDNFYLDQLCQLAMGLVQKLDISTYTDASLSVYNMQQARLKLAEEKLENLLKPDFDYKHDFGCNQKNEIKEGLLLNLDVRLYANPNFSCSRMTLIRMGLEDGRSKDIINIFANPNYSNDFVIQVEKAIKLGLFSEEQLTDPEYFDEVKTLMGNYESSELEADFDKNYYQPHEKYIYKDYCGDGMYKDKYNEDYDEDIDTEDIEEEEDIEL